MTRQMCSFDFLHIILKSAGVWFEGLNELPLDISCFLIIIETNKKEPDKIDRP